MFAELLAPSWFSLWGELQSSSRVLVSHRDPRLAAALKQILGDSTDVVGCDPDTGGVHAGEFDVVVTDMAGSAVARSHRNLFVVCDRPSWRPGVSVAPADVCTADRGNHLVLAQRIQAALADCADEQVLHLLCEQLKPLVPDSPVEREAVEESLRRFKTKTKRRLHAAVFSEDKAVGGRHLESLLRHGVRATATSNHRALFEACGAGRGPLCVLVTRADLSTTALIKELKRRDPHVQTLLACSGDAARHGASDWATDDEWPQAHFRVRRLIRRARRHHLFRHLLTTLNRSSGSRPATGISAAPFRQTNLAGPASIDVFPDAVPLLRQYPRAETPAPA